MTKILFISQYLNRGGTETFMMNVFRSLDCNNFHIDFLIFTPEETEFTKEVEEAGSVVYRLQCRKKSMFNYYKAIDDFFKIHAQEYSAIHFCAGNLSSIAPIYYAYKYKIPIRIVHAHSSSALGLHNKILHIAKRRYVKTITTHHFSCSSLATKWFFGSSPATVINNGIDVKKFSFDERIRTYKRKQLSISNATKVIGHVGRFVTEKNHTFILDVFSAYTKKETNSLLIFIGNGPLIGSIKQKVAALGIADKVVFLGERNDVYELMQVMDVFLMPSLYEGLPFVLIEAQCTGLPCIISDTINKDVAVTENISFLSLASPISLWVKKLSDATCINRKNQANVITAAGFSIDDTVKYLQNIYNNKKIKT